MAKLLMSCDDYVYCYKGKYYAGSQDKYEFYQRYLRVFDELRLVTRCVMGKDLNRSRVELSDRRIEYIPVPFFSGPKQYAKQYFKIGRLLRSITNGCDAAILRLPSTIGQRVCGKVMKAGIPYATEIVYDAKDGFENGTKLVNKLLWCIIHHQMQTSCTTARGVSCVTEHYLQQHYFSMLPNAFTSHYSSLALPKEFYTAPRKYPHKDIFTIAHVSNQVQFNGRKGFNEIIRAIKILKDRNVYVQLNFIGPDYQDGTALLSDFARSLGVEDRIHFMGWASRQQLSDYLDSSDLYVMPTTSEGLPRVIIEAMAKGLPCITTPVSGNPELITGHFLVDYNDISTLADRIEELKNDKKLYELTSSDNFSRSLQYEESILEKRRDEFYTQLKNCIKDSKEGRQSVKSYTRRIPM